MKINMNEILKDFKGLELRVEEKPMTIKEAFIFILMNPLDDDRLKDGKFKFELEKLGKEIWEGKSEFSFEDLTLIKERAPKCLTQMAIGPLWRYLEGAAASAV